MLTLKENKLYYHNGVYMGDVLLDVDGFYKFWPYCDEDGNNGYWDAGCLSEIASFLQGLNTDWEKQIEKYFSEQKSIN